MYQITWIWFCKNIDLLFTKVLYFETATLTGVYYSSCIHGPYGHNWDSETDRPWYEEKGLQVEEEEESVWKGHSDAMTLGHVQGQWKQD